MKVAVAGSGGMKMTVAEPRGMKVTVAEPIEAESDSNRA